MKQRAAKEVVKKPEQYEAAIYYFAKCKQEEKDRIITEGQKMMAIETENTRFIEGKIDQALRVGNRTLTEKERLKVTLYKDSRHKNDMHTRSV